LGGSFLVDTIRILRDGSLLSVVASTYLLVLLRFHPRLFLRHFPKEIRDIVPPKSTGERRLSVLLGLPLGLLFVGGILASAWLWRVSAEGSSSFWELFVHVFGLIFLFNLVDLLILDWLIVCTFPPRWLILPGTEHVAMPKEYLYHFKGFLIGTVVAVLGGLALTALLQVLF
jgi:hypothetical protein